MMKRWSSRSPGKKSQGRPLWCRFLRASGRLRLLRPANSSPITRPSMHRPSMHSRNALCQPLIRITRGRCSDNRHIAMETKAQRGNHRHQAGVGSNRNGHSMRSLPVLASTGRWRKNHVRPGRAGVYRRFRQFRRPCGRLRPTIAGQAAVSGPTVRIPTAGRTQATTVQRPMGVREATVAVGPEAMAIPASSLQGPGSVMLFTGSIKKLFTATMVKLKALTKNVVPLVFRPGGSYRGVTGGAGVPCYFF